ncbi:DUF6385 domain-containing protein, partial [Clostridium frigidicarnis]
IRNLSGVTDSVLISNDSVTVTALDLDIRNLSGATDSVAIIGLLTTSETTVASSITSGGIFPQNTSLTSEFSYFVVNNSADTVTVRLEISPTTVESYFIPDPNQNDTVIAPTDKAIIITSLYSNYMRLFYEATTTPTDFEVYYTARS